MATQLLAEQMVQISSGACVIDITPPTFSGITGLIANSDGSLTASWSAGVDITSLEYDVYIQLDTATDLFEDDNIVFTKKGLSARIYTLKDNTPLTALRTYFVGVRAKDSSHNKETNLISLSAQSNGVNIGSINQSDLLLIVQNLTLSGEEILASIDDTSEEISGSVDGDEDLLGTLEDC